MKKYQRFFVSTLVLCLIFVTFQVNASTEMDEMDKLLIAHRFMSSETSREGNDLWARLTGVESIQDLYDMNDNIIAYYIDFAPEGYAIVNANVENPVAIEFSSSDCDELENMFRDSGSKGVQPKITYRPMGMSQVYNETEMSISSESSKDTRLYIDKLSNYYDFLALPNSKEAIEHETQRKALDSKIAQTKGSFNFISWGSMPSSSYDTDYLSFAGTNWADSDDYPYSSTNCGSTAATNICMYYANEGYTELEVNNSVDDTYDAVFDYVGKGPVLNICPDWIDYVEDAGYTADIDRIYSFTSIKSHIDDEEPISLLLTTGNLWHWVVCVGWREYDSGSEYIRIHPGNKDNVNYFWLWGGAGNGIMCDMYAHDVSN